MSGGKPAPRVTPYWVALEQFCTIWGARYGVPYSPTPADKNQLGRLIRTCNAEMLAALPVAFRGYLQDLSPFVAQEMRHSLQFFCTSGGINKYRTNAPAVSAKEARSAEAIRQFANGEVRHAPR